METTYQRCQDFELENIKFRKILFVKQKQGYINLLRSRKNSSVSINSTLHSSQSLFYRNFILSMIFHLSIKLISNEIIEAVQSDAN